MRAYAAQHTRSNINILVYVDDIIIVAKDTSADLNVKEKLTSVCDVRDLGEAEYYLGMSLDRTDMNAQNGAKHCLRGVWHQS